MVCSACRASELLPLRENDGRRRDSTWPAQPKRLGYGCSPRCRGAPPQLSHAVARQPPGRRFLSARAVAAGCTAAASACLSAVCRERDLMLNRPFECVDSRQRGGSRRLPSHAQSERDGAASIKTAGARRNKPVTMLSTERCHARGRHILPRSRAVAPAIRGHGRRRADGSLRVGGGSPTRRG